MKKSIFSRAMDKLKKASNDQVNSAGEPKSHIDRRRHQRFDLAAFGCIEVYLPDGTSTVINDISYGGFAAQRSESASITSGATIPVSIKILGQACEAECNITHVGGASFGSCFVHGTPETLIFLRPILEDMRCGASCVELSKDMIKEKYQGKDWIVMRGEGPTDLILRSSHDGKTLIEGQLTFHQNGRYLSASHANGKTQYSGSIDDQGSATRMGTIASPELRDVRQTIQVLLGAYTQSSLPCLEHWISIEIERLSSMLEANRKVS